MRTESRATGGAVLIPGLTLTGSATLKTLHRVGTLNLCYQQFGAGCLGWVEHLGLVACGYCTGWRGRGQPCRAWRLTHSPLLVFPEYQSIPRMARRETWVWRYSTSGELNQRTRAVPVMGLRRRVHTLWESLQLMG